MTQPASAIRNEVFQLMDVQLSIFTQRSSLNDLDLLELHVRAGRIKELFEELDGLHAERTRTLAVVRRPRHAKKSHHYAA
jgi:hypothetical protein